MTDEIQLRRPTEDDHALLIRRVDEWWGGRKVHPLLPRLWFQHFAGSSWVAVDAEGRPIGFLIGFLSPDRPEDAYVHMIGVSPNHRRAGLGRILYERFFADVASRGARRVSAVTWPGNQASVGFHRALGFEPFDGPGTQNLYGTPAFADYDADGDDRVVFSRAL